MTVSLRILFLKNGHAVPIGLFFGVIKNLPKKEKRHILQEKLRKRRGFSREMQTDRIYKFPKYGHG